MSSFRHRTALIVLVVFLITMFPGVTALGKEINLFDELLPAAAPRSSGEALQWYLPGIKPDGFDEISTKLNERLAAETGDTVEFTFLDWENIYEIKDLLYASGKNIDLIFSASWYSYVDDVNSGYYYPIDNDIDKLAPKTKAVLGSSILKAARVDGELFALPVPGQSSAYSSGLAFRKDLVDKYKIDLSKIKKLDDVESVLKLIKSKQPEIIPLVNISTGGPFFDLTGFQRVGENIWIPGALSNDSKDDNKIYDEYTAPGTMAFFKTLHKFNKAGYLKSYSNQDSREIFAKLMSRANPIQEEYDSEYSWTFVNIGKPIIDQFDSPNSMNSVWATSKHPQRALSMMEYIYNDAVSSNLIHFGIEGKHYVKVSENVVDAPGGAYAGNTYKLQSPYWALGNRYLDFTWKNEDPNKYNKLKDYNKIAVESRTIGFTFDETPILVEKSFCNGEIEKYLEKLMTGEYDPVKYLPTLNEALEKAGVNMIIAEKQRQFDEWVEDQAALRLQNTSGIKLVLDGKPLTLKYPPEFSKDIPMVPMKQIFDSLDAISDYDVKTKTITAGRSGKSLKLVLGAVKGTINGVEVNLAAPPVILHEQVYIPLESACKSMGFEYSWSDAKKTADITRSFTEKAGNTWGNILNYGCAAEDGDWQYISMRDGIYKLKNDGSGKTMLHDKTGVFLNAAGDWLYYSDMGAESLFEKTWLYKMKTDGSAKTLLAKDECTYVNLMGEWIYYINNSDGDKPYRININGKARQKLSNTPVHTLFADEGWLYFQKVSDGNLYRMRTSGTDTMKLTNTAGDDNRIIQKNGDWIYYAGTIWPQSGICRMKADGSSKKFVVDVSTFQINMDETYIYYNDSFGNLYRINEEKKEKIKISNDAGYEINICGDWLYYSHGEGYRSLIMSQYSDDKDIEMNGFRINKDGSVKQLIASGESGKVTDVFRLPAFGSYTPLPINIPGASSGYTVKTAKEIVKQKNAVVFIKVFDEKGKLKASGSGFNIEPTGTVVTNFHVIAGASTIKCSFDNGKTYDTDYILNYNSVKDVAILKLNSAQGLPVVKLGNSDRAELADDVLAIGNPMEMQNTISDGLVSGIRDIFGVKYIQTTASISPGSSGGPLFNMNGDVIGVMSMTMWGSQNMNFAVPINTVRKLFESARRIPIQAVNNYDTEVVEFESNDSISSANSLQMDSIISANLYGDRDVDVFKFDLKYDGKVSFTGAYNSLLNEDKESTFEIKLMDRNGVVLKNSEETIFEEETSLQAISTDLKAGIYYISISGKTGNETAADYTILCIEN